MFSWNIGGIVRSILLKLAVNLFVCNVHVLMKQPSLSALATKEFYSVQVQKLPEPFL